MKTALVLGGGFAGCAAAHQLQLLGGWDVTLIEQAPMLGAGVRTQFYGGHPYTFGPRHFLTQNETVYRYLDALVPLRRCEDHEFITFVERDQAFYNFPIHVDDVARMPDKAKIDDELKRVEGVENAHNLEEYWIGSVGKTLYEKFIDKYSKKMWLIDDNRVVDTFNWSPKGVALKSGPRAAWDTALSAYPEALDGYNRYFDIATAGTRVLLQTKLTHYDIPKKRAMIAGEWRSFDIIVCAISPDIVFDRCYGELTYIGRDFHKIVLPIEFAFPDHVYFVYYANDEQFTRLVEYKKFSRYQSSSTLLGMEIPSMNGKYYPLPFKSEIAKSDRYHAEMPDGVFAIGRNGCYRYAVDIDDCIEQAMLVAQQIKEGGRDHPIPGARWR